MGRFTSILLLFLLGLSKTLARQVPIIDGVIGGIPKIPPTASIKPQLKTNVQTTPGKLRVVENSGVCGMFSLPFRYRTRWPHALT